jgi:hypothetical protein
MPPTRGSISSNGDAKPTCHRRVLADVGPWEIIGAQARPAKRSSSQPPCTAFRDRCVGDGARTDAGFLPGTDAYTAHGSLTATLDRYTFASSPTVTLTLEF